ncbi:MAG: hypothetical protein AB7O49_11820 [Sphingomonadales bacterium]
MTDRRFWLGLAAYLVPTFPLGYFWHLSWFAPQYHQLEAYRPDVIIPLGLASMIIQAALLSWLYPRLFGGAPGGWLAKGLKFGLLVGLFAWTLSTLAVGAKHVMTSVPLFVQLETAFTIVQYAITGPLIALAWRR